MTLAVYAGMFRPDNNDLVPGFMVVIGPYMGGFPAFLRLAPTMRHTTTTKPTTRYPATAQGLVGASVPLLHRAQARVWGITGRCYARLCLSAMG